MYLFVGLGNPGSQYLFNRHNIGFILVDALFHHFNFPNYKQKFNGQLSSGKIDNHEVLLLKPQTYMNLSGQSVQQVIQFYKINIDNVFVFHDDLDLLPFQIKTKKGGGAAGHNGLKSIDQHCGKEYWRFRFGIGRPPIKSMVSDYVLSNFSKQEVNNISSFLPDFCEKSKTLFLKQAETWPVFSQ